MKRTVAQRLFVLLAATGLLFAAVASVSADAGNPILGTIQSSSVVHPDGSVTVYVRGEWNWLSHDNDCNFDRAGTGVGIIWNDPTEPGYTVSKGAISAGVGISSLRAGDVVNTVDRMVHPVDRGNVPQGYTDATWQSTAQGYPVNAAGEVPFGQVFVDPITNLAAPGATEAAAWKGGCGREPLTAGSFSGDPWGSWGYAKNGGLGFSHTFRSVADVTSVCANFYDVHGGGKFDSGKFQLVKDADEITVDGNGDNSIDTNAFNVADGQNCIGLVPVPDIHIVKTATPTTLPFGGGSVTYTYDVTNTGNVLLSNVTVSDDKCATPAQLVPTNTLGGDTNNDGKLAVSGETWHFSCTTNITLTTTNIGTAHGFFGATEVTDTDTKTVTVSTANPILSYLKTVATNAAGPFTASNTANPGATLYFKIHAANTGNANSTQDVTDVLSTALVANSAAFDITTCSPACTYNAGTRTITWSNVTVNAGASADLTFRVVLNSVFPSGNTTLGNTAVSTNGNCVPPSNAADCNTTTVVTVAPPPPPVPPSPGIAITKTANPTSLPVGGGSVTYTYHVTNPTSVTLSNVTVTDDKCSPVTRTSGDTNANNLLETGENWTYTCTTTITATTTNTAVATGIGNGQTVTATAQATVTVAAATPTATPTPTPTPTPTGTVAAATSRPRITLPPTDGVNTGSGGGSDGLPIILLVLVGLAAFAPILIRANGKSRR